MRLQHLPEERNQRREPEPAVQAARILSVCAVQLHATIKTHTKEHVAARLRCTEGTSGHQLQLLKVPEKAL